MDPKLNSLLKWGIQNSSVSQEGNNNDSNNATAAAAAAAAAAPDSAARGITPEMLSTLFGGPSEADMMRAAMAAVHSDDVDLENKMIAFDNFEQLIESLDNANNMEPLGLWTPLVQLLGSEEADIRRMAAWCVGTAVQNNEKSQDKLIVFNVLPTLVTMATSDAAPAARKKAVYAISSAVRNYQPAMDELVKHLPDGYNSSEKVDASDMDTIDGIMDKLRAHPCETSA